MKRITQLQLFTMFTQFLFSTAIGFFIGPIIQSAGYMSWISVILGFAIGLGMAYFAYRLVRRRPDKFLGEYGGEIVGKWPHILIFTGVICVNLYMAAMILRELSDFIVLIYLPETPEWAIVSLFGICIVRAVRSGPIHLFRSAQGLFLFSVISVFTFPLFAVKEADFDKLIALLTDLQPHGIWEGTILSGALFGEMAFIVYFYPYYENKKKTYRTLAWSGVTAAFVTIINLVTTMLLFGTELAGTLTYPTLELIRYIRAGSFLENLDPLLIVFWLFSILLKIGLFLLLAALNITHLLRLKDHKPFTLGLGAAMMILSLVMFESTADVEAASRGSGAVMLLLKCSLPALYLLVDVLRVKKGSVPAPPSSG